MTDVLKHRFVSPKLDGTDLTQVQPSAWNDGHRFIGGADGQVLTRSTADATFGAVWARRPQEWTVATPVVAFGPLYNWDPGIVGNTQIFVSAGANIEITGIKPAAAPYAGQTVRMVLTSAAPGALTFYHEHPTSDAGSQIRTRPTSSVTVTGYWGFIELQWGPASGGAWMVGAYGNGHAV